MVGDQIGFDEGGVFESLRDPVITVTETKYRHNKAGLVTSEKTKSFNLTGAHILAMALGPALLALIAKIGDLDDEKVTGLLAGMPFGLIGMFIGWKYSGNDDDDDNPDAPPADEEVFVKKFIDMLTGAIDPFDWF